MKKILLIENNETDLNIIYLYLAAEGYSVFEAENLNEGLKVIEDIFPDLIIYNINNSIVEAFNFLYFLSKNYVTSEIPFILLGSDLNYRKLIHFNIKSVLIKPVQQRDLLKAVNNTFDVKKQEREMVLAV
jgi:CheY-like chemotaxis protein